MIKETKKKKQQIYKRILSIWCCILLLFGLIGVSQGYHKWVEYKVIQWVKTIIEDERNHTIIVQLENPGTNQSLAFELMIDKVEEELLFRLDEKESYQTIFNLSDLEAEFSVLDTDMTYLIEEEMNNDHELEIDIIFQKYIDDLKVNPFLFFVDKMSLEFNIMWMDQEITIKIDEIVEKI